MTQETYVQKITESLPHLSKSDLKAIYEHIRSLSSTVQEPSSGSPVDEIDRVQNQQIPPPEGEIPGSRHDQFFT